MISLCTSLDRRASTAERTSWSTVRVFQQVVNDEQVVRELAQFFASQIPEIKVVSEGLASLIGEDVSYSTASAWCSALYWVGAGRCSQ